MEAAAHFDNWQRSGRDARNCRQDLWPPLLRSARAIPGVEYIQVRELLHNPHVAKCGGKRAAHAVARALPVFCEPRVAKETRLLSLVRQACRVRGQVIQEMAAFFTENHIDVFLGASTSLAYEGNLVGLPQMVVPTGYVPVEGTAGPRQAARTVGIFGRPYEDGKVRAFAVQGCQWCHCSLHCLPEAPTASLRVSC